jgi:drug/metabolite transporter (DMT)-like permease
MGFLANAVIGVPFAFFSATAEPAAWAAISFLGIVQVGIAYILFALGIKKTPALLACLITALEPLLNPIWVALAIGEAPGPFTIIGGAVIIFAVVGYNIRLEKQG